MSSNLHLPSYNGSIVNVSIINGGTLEGLTTYFTDAPIPGHDVWAFPCHSFLIENESSKKKVLFDLGLRKEQEGKQSAVASKQIAGAIFSFDILRDVAEQLTDASVALSSIDSIVWSHPHFDHTGDPSLFPNTTSLVVGPGFKSNPLTYPGYPLNPNSTVVQDAFEGRELVEIEFDTGFEIGEFKAVDFFGDGSFYLLYGPGHTHDHMCALARTSENKFIFLGADAAHYNGLLRPSTLLPLPDFIVPSPFEDLHSHSFCPGSIFESIHPATVKGDNYRTTPFYTLSTNITQSPEDADVTIQKIQRLDASPDVLVVVAHDITALEIFPYFPETLNGWEVKGYKELDTWRFLGDFEKALDLAGP